MKSFQLFIRHYLACPFLKVVKNAMILGKNTPIVSIYGLNISFEMQF